MIKTDCFAYKAEKEECNCLRELYCKNEKCNFYKSMEEYRKEKIHKK